MSRHQRLPSQTRTCKVCIYSMQTESSETLFRCGYAYYAQPALERIQERMDHYPSVDQQHSCKRWSGRLQSLLDASS